MAKKVCQKRFELYPDFFYDNQDIIKLLVEYKKMQEKASIEFFPAEYQDLYKYLNAGTYISPNGNFIISEYNLIIFGRITKNEIISIFKNFEMYNLYISYWNRELFRLGKGDTITNEDTFVDIMPSIFVCGKCPNKSSCLLKKEEGKIDFSDDEKSTPVDLSRYTWSKEQEVFLQKTKKNSFLMVNAAAGTGKTTVINEALQQEGGFLDRFKSEDILLITFTNTAAKEMQARISAYANITKKDISGLTISTWHSLAFDILEKHWKELGYKKKPIKAFDNYQLKVDFLKSINRVINSSNLKMLDENAQGDIESFERTLFKNFVREQNSILLDEAFDIIAKAIHYQILKPKALIVDEFQDSSYKELRLLDILSRNLESLLTLGDIRQAIYSFRGGVNNSFLQLTEALKEQGKNVETLAFSESFRLPLLAAARSNEMLNNTDLPEIVSALTNEGNVMSCSRADLNVILNDIDGTKGLLARNNADLITLYISSLKYRDDVEFKYGNSLEYYPIFRLLKNIVSLFKDGESKLAQAAIEQESFNFHDFKTFMNFLTKYDVLTRFIYTRLKNEGAKDFNRVYELFLQMGEEPIKIKRDNINIWLLTAHGSKGMEFDNVILLNSERFKVKELKKAEIDMGEKEGKSIVYPDFIPNIEITHDELEARKVAFVATSRAKENLFIECKIN